MVLFDGAINLWGGGSLPSLWACMTFKHAQTHRMEKGWKKALSEALLGRSNYLKLLFSSPGVSFKPREATSRSVSTKWLFQEDKSSSEFS